MATKIHTLAGTDCDGNPTTIDIKRNKKKVIVITEDYERFCCKYDDLVELVNNLAPKKKDKTEEPEQAKSLYDDAPEGIALPTDGVT
jgi:hypothetical protein